MICDFLRDWLMSLLKRKKIFKHPEMQIPFVPPSETLRDSPLIPLNLPGPLEILREEFLLQIFLLLPAIKLLRRNIWLLLKTTESVMKNK